jgi:predicted ATP-grasp superfamily ATP-dependent carboligase
VLDPSTLYQLTAQQPEVGELQQPVMVVALTGFVDAGQAGRLAAEQILETLEHRVLARFDLDQVYDYRARRPAMVFDGDHWVSYETPSLELSLVTDSGGRSFLLLMGPEPDIQWERVTAAIRQLVERYDVSLTVSAHAIPMAVPHTRPIGVTAHATDPGLIRDYQPWVGQVRVPGNLGGLLELRLGQADRTAAGFAVHVPHYVAQNNYPVAAEALLSAVTRLTGLALPTEQLADQGRQVRVLLDEQAAADSEITEMVEALERQYDAFVGSQGRSLLAADTGSLPTGDELGAELERFLADENERRGRGDV